MNAERLPELMDRRQIVSETGLSESAADSLMRKCTLYRFDGLRRSFVKRGEVLEKLRAVPRPPEESEDE